MIVRQVIPNLFICTFIRRKPAKVILAVLILVAVIVSISDCSTPGQELSNDITLVLTVTSPAFKDGGIIPGKYSCWGGNTSPQVNWTKGPDKTAYYILILDDQDTPVKPFSHWVLYNIRGNITELHEGISTNGILDTGAIQGRNDRMKLGYFGPCPPVGDANHYRFTVYAVDTALGLASATREEVLLAIQDHILASGQLSGTYKQ
jgi:Raf kinase inhibitor-like YbhB/YbcL family protein